MKQAVIATIGEDRPGLVNEISALVRGMHLNIDDSRMTVLGGEFAILLMIEGNWNTLTKLEDAIPALEQQL